MSAKCSRCGMQIFDERGQSWGTQLLSGDWICDDDCELGLSLKPDVIKGRDPEAIIADFKRWNRPEELTRAAFMAVVIYGLKHPEGQWHWLCLSEEAREEMFDCAQAEFLKWRAKELEMEQRRQGHHLALEAMSRREL